MLNLKSLYEIHIKKRMDDADKAISALNYNSLILGAGSPYTYFEDDMDAVFKSNPHFAHWCPAKGPHHLIKYQSGKKPLLVYYSPDDFWHHHEQLGNPFWADYFDIIVEGDKDKLWSHLGNLSHAIFVGNDTKYAAAAGVKYNCDILMARLNWNRRYKSEYEVECLLEANKLASIGHLAAYSEFMAGGSAYDVHVAYLNAMKVLDEELPYQAIVGFDKNAAVLHYHKKEHIKNGQVLLIDSGASFNHYCADITRTYAREGCDSVFLDLLNYTISMQKEICQELKSGIYYPELHENCHKKIAKILDDVGILNVNGNYDFALQSGLTKTFFPHGLGHFLGIQVHDIGGKQLDYQGNIAPINPSNVIYRSLRFVGTLEEGNVVTIEPGIYFIPMLLNQIRNDKELSKYIDWKLVDRMIPFGGIRIEDDVLISEKGYRNLTREFLS
jgi:Xaa-Pro dipeptidase